MEKIIENFEAFIKEREMPLSKREIQNGQLLFNGAFRIRKNLSLPFGVVFDNKQNTKTIDYQVVYHRLAYVRDFDKKVEVLELLNELNEMKSGYYRFCLAGDGEIYMRLLARTTEDVQPVYEMMAMGGNIAKTLLPEIEKVVGENTNAPDQAPATDKK